MTKRKVNYKKAYMRHYGITEADVLLCNCGRVAVELHHRIKKSLGGTDEPTNLEPICRTCHSKIHNG